MNIDDETQFIERVCARLEERLAIRLGRAMPLDPVYTVLEAMNYIGAGSHSAFYRWTDLRGVTPCGSGKYRKSALDRALDVSATLIRARRSKIKSRAARGALAKEAA